MPLIPRYQWVCRHCRCCDRVRLWLAVSGFGVGTWRVRLLGCPVSRRRFASARSSRCCSTSFQWMKRQPAVRCCGLSAFSEQRIGGVQIDTFEVGLGFQEELGEVFGHLAADRVLEGTHVRPVQRLYVRCAVPLLGVTRACVHVRVNRVNHVQESVLRDPPRRSVGHELARKDWSMRAHSIGLLFIDNLCPLVRVPHAIL